MSSRQEDIAKFNSALNDQRSLFTEDEVCDLTNNLNYIEIEKGIAESGSVNFLKSWIAIGFKVTRSMVEIATKHGNLAFLKECFADNSVNCDLTRIREIAIQQNHSHIVEWLDELESQP